MKYALTLWKLHILPTVRIPGENVHTALLVGKTLVSITQKEYNWVQNKLASHTEEFEVFMLQLTTEAWISNRGLGHLTYNIVLCKKCNYETTISMRKTTNSLVCFICFIKQLN